MKVSPSILLLAIVFASPALADPICSKLAWPLDKERALLQGTTQQVPSGATLETLPAGAMTFLLKPGAQITLPHASQKPTDPTKFAGFANLPAPDAGDFLISLSGEAWIDVIQDGALASSSAHTGDANCPGLRKSVRFTLVNKPLTLQISNSSGGQIEVVITPAR